MCGKLTNDEIPPKTRVVLYAPCGVAIINELIEDFMTHGTDEDIAIALGSLASALGFKRSGWKLELNMRCNKANAYFKVIESK